MPSITFIVPVGSEDVFQRCFTSSPLFGGESDFQILAQRGFKCSGEAFNDGLDRAVSDLIVCVHQDVVLPAMWAKRFLAAWRRMESQAIPVGVVGCMGMSSAGEPAGHIYRHDRELFPEQTLPARVETLDEMLISFRKSSGLRFDPQLPSFFFYAVDMCLQSSSKGLHNFAVDAPCFHQAKDRNQGLPTEFFVSEEYMIRKWKKVLPVRSLSGTMGGWRSYWRRRIKQSLFQAIGYIPEPWWTDLPRVDPAEILARDAACLEKEADHEASPRR
jgi:hypothetical protein